ncbi:MAG: hypothetical protein IJR14_07925 [Synergistaceae bacterium]|nr:hypothetical protein [Synergistaceae bacterium]
MQHLLELFNELDEKKIYHQTHRIGDEIEVEIYVPGYRLTVSLASQGPARIELFQSDADGVVGYADIDHCEPIRELIGEIGTRRGGPSRSMSRLLDLLDALEEKGIRYQLDHMRFDSPILVELCLPGQRWEVEFMCDRWEDGTERKDGIELEKFIRRAGCPTIGEEDAPSSPSVDGPRWVERREILQCEEVRWCLDDPDELP